MVVLLLLYTTGLYNPTLFHTFPVTLIGTLRLLCLLLQDQTLSGGWRVRSPSPPPLWLRFLLLMSWRRMPVWMDGVLTCTLLPSHKADGVLLSPGYISISWNLQPFFLALKLSFPIMLLSLSLSDATISPPYAMLTIKVGLGLNLFATCPWSCGIIVFLTIFACGQSTSKGLITPGLTIFLDSLLILMTIIFPKIPLPPCFLTWTTSLTLTFLPLAFTTICLDMPPVCRTTVLSLLMLSLYLGLAICTFSPNNFN